MLTKQSILKITNVYTASAFPSGNNFYVGAGSETAPEVQLFDMAARSVEMPEGCPGGMMSFIPVPGVPDTLVTIMGLFPPFIGHKAGLFLHRRSSRGWKTIRMMDLPFAHRCEFLRSDGKTTLVAATVSQYKENPADWSRKGEIHLINLGNEIAERWESEVIGPGITRNHGMAKVMMDGVEKICVSGAEGIFALSAGPDGSWELEPLFDKEVSEMAFADLDGNGHPELVTIEPFHGDTLNIYQRTGGGWKMKFSDSLSFGHGLSSGLFNGTPVIVAGNRRDSLALEIFTVDNLDKGIVNRVIIEENAGPTQTQVFSFGKMDYILSANQRKNEVALYAGSLPL
jgi:hypothetical protein